MTDAMTQEQIDQQNRQFWQELCGSGLARHIGITDHSPESLRRFDAAYMDIYPYLLKHVCGLEGRRVLEVGLGYGTLSQIIASQASFFRGLDISAAAAELVNTRLRIQGLRGEAICGSVLDIPFPEASFDVAVSIGCLHHTGNMQRAVDEIHRVLAPGGRAIIMVYNRFSLRQWKTRGLGLLAEWFKGRPHENQQARVRAQYDASADGEAAPFTELFSRGDIRRVFSRFAEVRCRRENMDPMTRNGSVVIDRKKLLGLPARLLGLDWYITARKAL
ncbi:MAG: class I SAM-dependent methyltransferase [Planctomycetaceae bacterium]|nr:class I SAM-dependent methyltransferase [Planctomycetaceae bacterium]